MPNASKSPNPLTWSTDSKLGRYCHLCGKFVGRRRGNLTRLSSLSRAVDAMFVRHLERCTPKTTAKR